MTDTQPTSAEEGAPAKKATSKKSATTKSTAKKTSAKRTSSAKKTTAKRSTSKKSTAKKPTAKKPTRKTGTKTARNTVKKAATSRTARGVASTRAAAEALVARASAATQRPVDVGKALVEKTGERVADLGRAVAAPSSAFFARAPIRARELAADPEALRGLADKAMHSASGRSGPVGEVADEFKTLGRLVAAYARGDYRDIPLDSLIMVIAGLVYVVSPIDLIPDFVPVAGYADDAVAVGFVIRQVHHELAAFREWEAGDSSNV
jgi:uncharacterized membrane protein YkvA (DUF1232 family)